VPVSPKRGHCVPKVGACQDEEFFTPSIVFRGVWSRRLEIEFSHGLCPDCLAQYKTLERFSERAGLRSRLREFVIKITEILAQLAYKLLSTSREVLRRHPSGGPSPAACTPVTDHGSNLPPNEHTVRGMPWLLNAPSQRSPELSSA